MRKDFECSVEPAHDVVSSPQVAAKRPVVTLDVSLFEEYLADSDLTDDQKHEFLTVLWSIIVGFVDLGFGIHPVQQALASASSEAASEKSAVDDVSLIPFRQEEQKDNDKQSLRHEIVRGLAVKEEQQ